ncbi:MAG: hypothetical protein GY935_27030 [Gammaproteobacteria bacterium]|nr:hypothetical protein [Gammaproteobacteria bacterium]
MKLVLFQATRELLVNVARHAQVQNVSVNWEHRSDKVILAVTDDGASFDNEGPRVRLATEGGFGLFALRERFKLLGAEIEIRSLKQGSRVTITAPLNSD